MNTQTNNHPAKADKPKKSPGASPGTAPGGKPGKPGAPEESLDDVIKRLGASGDGLSGDEAAKRLDQYGPNEIIEKKENPLLKLLTYFWGPIPWMIEAAVILSAVVKDWTDCAIIFALLVMNAGVGFWEEFQAGNVIEALKEKLARDARVKRDGAWSTIKASSLVPGDLIRLRNGNIVPADIRFMDDDTVQIDQSALTGESLPVERGKGGVGYSGSIIRQGESNAVVYATGENTYFGKTAKLAGEEEQASHFQKAILKVGDFLIVIAIALVIVILAVALFRGDRMITSVQFALILTVAAIPVAMPTVLTVTMAVGARILAKHQAVVSRLASIEEMAGIDILCSDKTGTLTQNKLTLDDPYTVGDAGRDDVMLCGTLASREEDEDPIDMAIIGGFQKGGGDTDGYKVSAFSPFDSVRKRTEATVTGPDGKEFKVAKGAPQVILELAAPAEDIRKKTQAQIEEFAGRGYRSLGVARTKGGDDWTFLGILPLFDPPREDSAETIRQARNMGINVKMVTGDQMAIGREIAHKLGLGDNFIDASAFPDTKEHETGRLADAIEKADGFAQVFPEHKYHIVDVLQRRKHIVGMTGDGVNDAPALNKADCGVAVSGATDAARSAASIVLLTPGLSVIIEAIRISRRIFQRMNSYAIYRIAETIRVLLFMTLSIIIFNFYPVTAVMIVLLAILNDGAILSIAYDNVRFSNKPEAWDMPRVLGMASILGVVGVVESFGIFYIAERIMMIDRSMIQTLMYLKLSVAGHLTVFVARTRGPFWSIRPSKVLFIAVICTQALATLLAVYGILMPAIGWKLAGMIWGYALIWFLIEDRAKLAGYRILDSVHSGYLTKLT